jgi:hypothetical protein
MQGLSAAPETGMADQIDTTLVAELETTGLFISGRQS